MLLALVLPGCVSDRAKNGASVRASNSQPMAFESQEIGQIDLISLIDPENRRATLQGRNCSVPARMPRNVDEKRKIFSNELSCAVEAFQTYYMTYSEYETSRQTFTDDNKRNDKHYESAVNSLALALRRNQIQDRIMLRSDALCSDFTRRLGLDLRIGNEATGVGNWLSNYGSLVVSGVGSLFLNGDAIFVISNAARFGGVPGFVNDKEQLEVAVMQLAREGMNLVRNDKQALINERRFFKKQPEDPITGPALNEVFEPLLQPASVEIGDGLPAGVTSTYQEMQKTIGVVSIGSYTLEQGLSDVIDYHASCSIAAGLNRAADRLSKVSNSQ